MVKLKVCGITSLADAQAAVAAGAEYLGFNFYRPSPRYIAPTRAKEIIEQLPETTISVGIFVNESSPDEVLAIVEEAGIDLAQLHGDETPEYCARVGSDRVIKAFRAGANFEPARVCDYPAAAILLDAYDAKLYGGTGKTTNWEAAQAAARLVKLFLAGGLGPENISAAIGAVDPYAVDVNSGVESAPGRKDYEKLRRLKLELKK
jgi:phosphoribosylanthranilate isomerase